MLVKFAVTNFRSIRDEAELSMMAGPGTENRHSHVTDVLHAGGKSLPLLNAAAIYGANAAGKTNLLVALQTMQKIVIRRPEDFEPLPVVPFRFDSAQGAEPSTFDVTCVAGGVRYQYGFSATSNEIESEWLYAWPKGRVQLWFEREGDEFKLGGNLTGDREVWRRATRSDSLFLTTSAALNGEQMRPVFDWFARTLHVAGIGGWSSTATLDWCSDNRKVEVIKFLRAADMAIADVEVVEEELPAELLAELPPTIRAEVEGDTAKAKMHTARFAHESSTGKRATLDLNEESDGTQKLFALARPWLETLQSGYVVVLDELHDNLHPSLVQFLLGLFHSRESNPHGAQLVFSTHDTSILGQDALRRDQVWFCERNDRLETKLFPLTDFHPRKGLRNLERSYLSGRYGAVPYLRPIRAVAAE